MIQLQLPNIPAGAALPSDAGAGNDAPNGSSV